MSVTRVGEDFGFESIVARVDIEGPNGRRVHAIKLCTADGARGEHHAYTALLPSTNVRRPHWSGARDDGEFGVTIVGFVDGRQGDVLAGCGPETVLDVATSLASLHGTWWADDRVEVPSVVDLWRRPLTADHIRHFEEVVGDDLPDGALDVVRGLPARIDSLADELAGHPFTVVHGDMHLDNVMVHDDGTATILDWGRPRRAPAAIDVARCFIEMLDAHPDDDEGGRFIAHYHNQLRRAGVTDYPESSLREAISAAHLLFVPGVVRWAASNPPPPGSRLRAVMRAGLARVAAVTTPLA